MHRFVMAFVLLTAASSGIGQEYGTTSAGACRPGGERRLPPAGPLQASGNSMAKVVLKTRVFEVSLTKLRQLGIDFQCVRSASKSNVVEPNKPRDIACQLQSRPGQSYSVLAPSDPLLKSLDALREHGLARVLAEPTLVTLSDRPASFQCGSRTRVAVPKADGSAGVEEAFYGTRLDFLAAVVDDKTIHLTYSLEVSQLDLSNRLTVAGEALPVREALEVNTTADLPAGQTVLLKGPLERRHGSSVHLGAEPRAETPAKAAGKLAGQEPAEEIETLVLLTTEVIPPLASQSPTKAPTRR